MSETKDDKKKVKNLSKSCWKGYKAVGLKSKNGKQVPNCVPVTKSIDAVYAEEVEVEPKVFYFKSLMETKAFIRDNGGSRVCFYRATTMKETNEGFNFAVEKK